MPNFAITDPTFNPPTQAKPCLFSYDSGPEFSLEHFLEVRRLVALADQDERELKSYVFDDALVGANT